MAEFLAERDESWTARPLERRALVHLHCHQKATADTDCDAHVLERLGLEAEVLDSGCCGLAGSFGYEAGEPYEISMAAGERVLLPAVRDAGGALVVTDGFSCRSQIRHGAGTRAHHTAEVAHMALVRGPDGPAQATRKERDEHGQLSIHG
jgi:Fe-S oxidoreductase